MPGAANLTPLLARFCARGAGLVCAISDVRVRALARMIEDRPEVEIVPFGSLVSKFLDRDGPRAMSLAQSGHEVAAIAEACESLEEDSPLYLSRHFAGLHRALARTLGELRGWGFDPERLEACAEAAGPELASLLRSLALVERRTSQTLFDLGCERLTDRMLACTGSKSGLHGEAARLMIVLNRDAAPSQIEWIQWVARAGAHVTVICEGCACGDEDGWPASGFERAPKATGTASRLLAGLAGLSLEDAHESPQVQIESAADALAEVEWTLRACRKLVEEGVESQEIAVFARNMDEYRPLVEASAKRLEVPVRIVDRSQLTTNRFVQWTLDLLRACESRDVRLLGRAVRHSYVGLRGEGAAELETELEAAHAGRGDSWSHLEEWVAGCDAGWNWLQGILEWRREAQATGAPLTGWHARLRDLLGRLMAERAESAVRFSSSARDERARSAMLRSLSQRASVRKVRSEEAVSLHEFVEFAAKAWEESEYTVPPADFGVPFVSSADDLGPVQALFVLGMLEGSFPGRRREDPILTDEQRAELSQIAELPVALRDSQWSAAGDRLELLALCAAPADRLTLSYPQTGEDRDNVPAFYLDEVEAASGGKARRVDHRLDRLTPSQEPMAEADRALAEAIAGPRVHPAAPNLASDVAKAALKWPETRAFEPEEIRRALTCPFQFMAHSVLKLRPHRFRSRWGELLSLPRLAKLTAQPSPEAARRALNQQLEALLEREMARSEPWEIGMLRNGAQRLIEGWVAREFRARELWPRQGDVSTDVKFGEQGTREALWGDVRLTGQVPAITEIEGYRVAHVFRSRVVRQDQRNDKLSEADWAYVALLLYALMPETGGGGQAVEVDGSGSGRELLMLSAGGGRPLAQDTGKDVRRFDVTAFEGQSETVSHKATWTAFLQRSKALVNKGVRRIRETEVEPTPGDDCEWCEYGELCRSSKEFNERDSAFGET